MNTIPQTRIHKDAIKAWRITTGLFSLFWFLPSALMVLPTINGDASWLLPALCFVAGLILYILTVILFPSIRWKRWRYDVSDKEIDMLRGIIISKRTLVPINRIQHVDTRQGPVYRKFSLSTVTVSTAATTHEIPALDDETAKDLRDRISTLVRKVKEDV